MVTADSALYLERDDGLLLTGSALNEKGLNLFLYYKVSILLSCPPWLSRKLPGLEKGTKEGVGYGN